MKYYLHLTKEETEKPNNVTNGGKAQEQQPQDSTWGAVLQSHVHNLHVNHVSKETIRVKPLILSHSTTTTKKLYFMPGMDISMN